jgi:hypothetical protein
MFDKTINRRGAFQTVASLATAVTGSSSWAQGAASIWPQRPIKIVMPVAAETKT